jgi:aryl-alcohol dehydrogenase-like predicted oxidoreductase
MIDRSTKLASAGRKRPCCLQRVEAFVFKQPHTALREIPVTLQPQYSLLSRESEWEIVPAALHNGIGPLPWSPLAGGFLTGKYQRGGTPPSGSRAGAGERITSTDTAASAITCIDRPHAGAQTIIRKR